MGDDEQKIKVAPSEFIKMLVKLTVDECMPKVIEEHQKSCQALRTNKRFGNVSEAVIAAVITAVITAVLIGKIL